MEDLASLHDVTDEAVPHRDAFADRRWGSDDDVERKSCSNAATYSGSLLGGRSGMPHHNQ